MEALTLEMRIGTPESYDLYADMELPKSKGEMVAAITYALEAGYSPLYIVPDDVLSIFTDEMVGLGALTPQDIINLYDNEDFKAFMALSNDDKDVVLEFYRMGMEVWKTRVVRDSNPFWLDEQKSRPINPPRILDLIKDPSGALYHEKDIETAKSLGLRGEVNLELNFFDKFHNTFCYPKKWSCLTEHEAIILYRDDEDFRKFIDGPLTHDVDVYITYWNEVDDDASIEDIDDVYIGKFDSIKDFSQYLMANDYLSIELPEELHQFFDFEHYWTHTLRFDFEFEDGRGYHRR